jgi:hypothetical protein
LGVSRIRHTRAAPCPICHGYESMERGTEARCYGYSYATRSGREYCICTREEFANGAEYQEGSGGYKHFHDPATSQWRPWLPAALTSSRMSPNGTTTRTSDPDAHTGHSRKDKGAFVAEMAYPYHDEIGTLLFEVVRYQYERGKDFRQRRPDGNDGWVWNLNGVRRVLYRLPDLLAAGVQALVYLVEGEKHADALHDLGLIATTNPQGGEQWRTEYAAFLRERQIVVLADNDATGTRWTRAVLDSLTGVAASVRVLNLPGLPPKGDVLDWLDSGGTAERLIALAEATKLHEAADAAATGAAEGWVPRIINLSEVQPERVRWLWDGYIPLGKVVLVDGDPGMGKSTLLYDLAARISTGAVMPDGSRAHIDRPAGVVILSAEDGLADTIRPRLDAAGADPDMIFAIDGLTNGEQERSITLADIPAIEQAILRVEAKLVIIDPLMAYLGSETNSYRDQDVRGLLAPLARVAEKHGVAIVVVRHLSKGQSTNVLYRGGGSIGIIGAARVALMVGRDPDDPDGPRRILAVAKSNLAAFPPALAYHIEEAGNGVGYIVWEGETHHTAAAISASASPEHEEGQRERDEVAQALRAALTKGRRLQKEIMHEVRAATGASESTIHRARRRVGIISEREGFGPGSLVYWHLPDDDDGGDESETASDGAVYVSHTLHTSQLLETDMYGKYVTAMATDADTPTPVLASPFLLTPRRSVAMEQPQAQWVSEHEHDAVRAWAQRAAAGGEEGHAPPNTVRIFAQRHSIEIDAFGPMRSVGKAVLRALEPMESVSEVTP